MRPSFLHLILSTLLLLCASPESQAQRCEPQPDGRSRCEAVDTTGRRISCSGAVCFASIQSITTEAFLNLTSFPEFTDDGIAIDRDAFCQDLRDRKPQNCDAGNSPSVPGVNIGIAAWRQNHGATGCNTSLWTFMLEGAISATNAAEYYTGNPDRPFGAANFAPACIAHHECYATVSDRNSCDDAFTDQTTRVCISEFVPGSMSAAVCGVLNMVYRGAVYDHGGTDYEIAYGRLACALWHEDMDGNQCSRN